MATEALDPNQPWPIDIGPPEEPPRNRRIEAVKDGIVVVAWQWRNGSWHDPTSFADQWARIVQAAIGNGYTLRSVPVVDPVDAGTAEIRRRVRNGTLDGDWEWRDVFRAALEAYRAAGGLA